MSINPSTSANPQNAQFPLNNPAYNLIVILHEKSKALQAYERYLQDFQSDNALRQALVSIRMDEQRHIELLKAHLPRILGSTEGPAPGPPPAQTEPKANTDRDSGKTMD